MEETRPQVVLFGSTSVYMRKYHNKKVEIDGHKFDSRHEAEIYLYLKQQEQDGNISQLALQVPFILQDKFKINGRTVREIKYLADFTFTNSEGQLEVWDAKGYRTDVYSLKKKLFEYQYGVEIQEV